MKEVLEVVEKAREDMTNFAGHLLYTRWPTTELNIVGNNVHYNLMQVLRKVDGLIGALTAYLESPGGPSMEGKGGEGGKDHGE